MDLNFREDEIERYGRQILLPEIGGIGQAKLRAAKVLVVGAGGLGCPVLLSLAGAGIGTIGVIDADTVALSNLHRQMAHTTARIGQKKTLSAAQAMREINPDPCIHTYDARLDTGNCADLIAQYDLVCDCSDNPETRFMLADACFTGARTLVSAAVRGFDGQLSTFKPHTRATAHDDAPCYRCLYPAPPPDGAQSCTDAGVLGCVTTVMGGLQAAEVIKEITGIGESLSGRLLIWNMLSAKFRTIAMPRDEACAVCGDTVRLPMATYRCPLTDGRAF